MVGRAATDVLEAVAERRRAWIDAVNAGDADRYGELVCRDVVWLPPSGEPVEGREAFRAWLAPYFERYRYDFSVEPADVRPFDRWCGEVGGFRSVLTPEDGGDASTHEGRYCVLWRRDEDAVWRIERYVDGLGAAT